MTLRSAVNKKSRKDSNVTVPMKIVSLTITYAMRAPLKKTLLPLPSHQVQFTDHFRDIGVCTIPDQTTRAGELAAQRCPEKS
jgi:hypothetical protein